MKLRLTLTCEYEAYPAHYGTTDIDEIIKIDQKCDPLIILGINDYTVKIEEVEETKEELFMQTKLEYNNAKISTTS